MFKIRVILFFDLRERMRISLNHIAVFAQFFPNRSFFTVVDMIDAAKISDISISRFGSGLRIIFFEGEKTYEKDLDKAAEWYWKALEAGYEPREEGRRT